MFFRAMLVAMDEWASKGVAPPPSRIPTRAEGTLVPYETWRARYPTIPGAAIPVEANPLTLLDFGSESERGILTEPPRIAGRNDLTGPGPRYTVLVPAVDADGNEIPGVRAPMVQAPLGTYTGWNPRARGYGHGMQWRFEGSYIPFAETAAERAATGDPRPAILERYPDKAAYQAAIGAAARRLVAERLMLAEDVARCEAAAADWGRPRHAVISL
jgi:hypothetical protein